MVDRSDIYFLFDDHLLTFTKQRQSTLLRISGVIDEIEKQDNVVDSINVVCNLKMHNNYVKILSFNHHLQLKK